jgi:hypothetical protein
MYYTYNIRCINVCLTYLISDVRCINFASFFFLYPLVASGLMH